MKFLTPPDDESQATGPGPQKRLNLKKIGIWSYAIVVLSILVALVFILLRPVAEESLTFTEAENEAIQAVLEGGGSVQRIPMETIDSLIPIRKAMPAWKANAASWNRTGSAHIAIVIDDLGLDQEAVRQLALFEAPLTMAFLPYAEDLPAQTKAAAEYGHELIVHLPMQPKNANADPGPNALLETIGAEEFERRVIWNLNRFEGFVGINNHMGSALTENPGLMVRVMVHLRKNGYLYLDSLTSPNSVAIRAAIATGVPHIARDIFLDNERDIGKIVAQLEKTRRIAQSRGYAIAIGHPYPETLKALQFWYGSLDKTKYTLVPLSQLVANQIEKTAELDQPVSDHP